MGCGASRHSSAVGEGAHTSTAPPEHFENAPRASPVLLHKEQAIQQSTKERVEEKGVEGEGQTKGNFPAPKEEGGETKKQPCKNENAKDWFEAAVQGDVEKLLELGQKCREIVDCQDDEGESALLKAVRANREEVVEVLLGTLRSNGNLQRGDGGSVLMVAAEMGRTQIARLLLEGGADVDLQDKNGFTALMHATRNARPDVASLLIERKADVNLKSREGGRTALMFAAELGRPKIASLLLNQKGAVRVEEKDADGLTALLLSAQEGRPRVASLLLQHHADTKVRTEDGLTPLHLAAYNGRQKVVALLLQAKASASARTDFRSTPLMLAAENGHTEVVSVLLEDPNASDINAFDKETMTALMYACNTGHADVVALLLQKGADVDATQIDGYTALMGASHHGHPEVVSLLLKHKADPKMADLQGFTSLMLAAQDGHLEVAALHMRERVDLDAQAVEGDTALMLASQNGHVEIVALFLSEGASLDLKNEQGWTALMLAAEGGHPEIVAVLLQGRAEVNSKSQENDTALMLASEHGHVGAASLLLEHNAETNAQNDQGDTALIMACRNGQLEMAVLLLQSGADASITREDGATAASVAAEKRHQDIKKLLEGQSPSLLKKPTCIWTAAQKEVWQPIADLLCEGALSLWPLSVLRLLLEKQRPVPRRQDVEGCLRDLGMDNDFIQSSLQDATKCASLNFPLLGGFTVVCLSFGWLSPAHPDPHQFHLRLLVEDLNKQWWAQGENGNRVFVFWDFMSLFQKPRSEEEDRLFHSALSQLDLLYSSTHTRVFRSTGVPPESLNPVPYQQRGWPTFETCVTGFKPSRLIHQLPTALPQADPTEPSRGSNEKKKLEEECVAAASFNEDSDADDSTKEAGVFAPAVALSKQEVVLPLSPYDFNSLLETKRFTNGADSDTVRALYRQFVHRTASSVQQISFAGRSLFSDEEAKYLSGLFRYLQSEAVGPEEEGGTSSIRVSLTQLDLSHTDLSDEGAVPLVEVLGGVGSLRVLNLRETNISVQTLKALGRSFKEGGMGSVGFLILTNCSELNEEITDEDVPVLLSIAETVQRRGKLMHLDVMNSTKGLSEKRQKELVRKVDEDFTGCTLWI